VSRRRRRRSVSPCGSLTVAWNVKLAVELAAERASLTVEAWLAAALREVDLGGGPVVSLKRSG